MAAVVLETRALGFAYPDFEPVLEEVDFALRRGEKLALLGANGAGKSTLLLLLDGLLKPSTGAVLLNGAPVAYHRRGLRAWRSKTGLVFQDPDDQLFAPTVFEDVSFGPLNLGCSEKEVRRRTEAALDLMAIPDLGDRATHLLSFGQRKRVALAGVLAMEPEILLLDEPTAGLDPRSAEDLLQTLDRLSRAGTSMVVATHDMDAAYAWADRIALFGEKRVLACDTPETVFSDGSLLDRLRIREPLLHQFTRILQDGGLMTFTERPPRTRQTFGAALRRLASAAPRPVEGNPPMTPLDVSRIPCTIITGFLGAGKTTIVRHILEHGHGKRIAVIVNEFGDVGIDGDILKSCGDAACAGADIVELANGCLCCTVADDFVPALNTLLDREPKVDHIVIETSGLALPKPLVQAFQWPPVKSRVTVDAVVAVVDGLALAEGRVATDIEALEAQRRGDTSIDHENPIDEVFVDQLACADLVLMTRTDLLDDAARQRAEARIRPYLPPSVRLVPATNGQVDVAVLMGLNLSVEDRIDHRITLHDGAADHDHDDFESIVVDMPEITDPATIAARVRMLATDLGVLRVKGYLAVAAKPMRLLLQAVGARVTHHYDRTWLAEEARVSRLVVIAEKGIDADRIRRALLAGA